MDQQSWNNAIDRATEVVSEWLTNGRDPVDLFDRLSDLKIWTTNLPSNQEQHHV